MHPSDQQDPDAYDDPEMVEAEDQVDEAVAGASAWGVSVVLHAVALAILVFVVFINKTDERLVDVTITTIDPPVEKEKPPEKRLLEQPVTIECEVEAEDPVVHELDLPVEELQTEDEIIAEQPVKGREEADAISEMGGLNAFMAIGPAGSASGMKGLRSGGGPQFAIGKYGGHPRSLGVVDAALRWFVRHQSPNGQWDVDGYPMNCQEAGPKCEPGSFKTDIQGDVACTGYALLCFLGRGYDHRSPNRYRTTVQKAVDWLVSVQQADGLLGVRNYEHPVAVMALAEAYAMTNDPSLRDPVQRGVDVILARQAQGSVTAAQSGKRLGDYGLGWDYTAPKFTRMDSSVSGWNVMALKAAKAGGISTGDGMQGAREWLQGAWEAANQDKLLAELDPYAETIFPYTWNGSNNKVDLHQGDLTCVGLLCAVFLGHESGDTMLETMANWCDQHQRPSAWPTDTYYLYYNTLGMFQMGGDKWKAWNDQVLPLLMDAQRDGPECFAGSWDPQGAGGHHISEVGRLLVTAYCCLSLEVYYRHAVLAEQRGEAAKGTAAKIRAAIH